MRSRRTTSAKCGKSAKNTGKEKRELSVFVTTAFDLNGYAQPVYYSAVTTSFTEFLPSANAVFNRNLNPYRPHALSSGYIMSSERAVAYDGNLEKFIGVMGTFTKPYILERGADCACSAATVRTRGGVLQNKIILAPGESKDIYYILGLIEDEERLLSQNIRFCRKRPRSSPTRFVGRNVSGI